MSRTARTKKKVTLALPPFIMKQAEALADVKEMGFDHYVSELVWVAVATHRTNLRLLEQNLGHVIEDKGE